MESGQSTEEAKELVRCVATDESLMALRHRLEDLPLLNLLALVMSSMQSGTSLEKIIVMAYRPLETGATRSWPYHFCSVSPDNSLLLHQICFGAAVPRLRRRLSDRW